MFTQPCFIRKNTPELRMKLKELGYKCNNGKWMGSYLATFKRYGNNDLFYCGTPEYDLPNNPSLNDSIDCGTNERLFLAIAALRDDTDKYQLFVNGNGEFFKCYENEFSHFRFDTNDILNIANAIEFGTSPLLGKPIVPYEDTKNWHKATVEELIEHFKYK